MLAAELETFEERQQRPYAEGGPPVTDADFEDMLSEFDLSLAIDPAKPIGGGKSANEQCGMRDAHDV